MNLLGAVNQQTLLLHKQNLQKLTLNLRKNRLKAHIQAIQFINENPEEAIQLFLDHIKEITGKELSSDEVTKAFARLKATTDVNEDVIKEMAIISKEAGLY